MPILTPPPSSPSPSATVARYFQALNAKDTGALEEVYAKSAHFDDNVFHYKDRDGIVGMWSKLPADARVEHEIVKVDGNTVVANLHWSYTLAGTKVKNDETSTLTVVDGKIVKQREHFDFGVWAHQLAPWFSVASLNRHEWLLAPVLFHFGG